jgi:sugar O-acyltransferase (sialic acid O-acetyltransferase NeuD family)
VTTAIYGAGGFAREVAWLVEECGSDPVCFIDDDTDVQGTELNGLPVLSLEEAHTTYPEAAVVGAIGTPAAREAVMDRAAGQGFRSEIFVHPSVRMSRWIEMGEGTVICAGNILTTNIELGRHVQINLDCTIGHDVRMGDFVTLAPGAHVSGWVHFGRRVYVGTGAVIINGTSDAPIQIADDAIIGAGACVTRSVESGSTVVGVPARPLQRR